MHISVQQSSREDSLAEVTIEATKLANGEIAKSFPISEGDTSCRKSKPHIVAGINEMCTGCPGSPTCLDYCPVAECMFWMLDPGHPSFVHIRVDPLLCIGCKLCTSKGPEGMFLEGYQWDAIDMVPLADFEAKCGTLPY